MKTFKSLLSEVAQPKSEDEQNFIDKHVIDFIDHPESEESQHTAKNMKRAKRLADYEDGEDEEVYESTKQTSRIDKDNIVYYAPECSDFAKLYVNAEKGNEKAAEKLHSQYTIKPIKSGFGGSGEELYTHKASGAKYKIVKSANGKGFHGTDHTILKESAQHFIFKAAIAKSNRKRKFEIGGNKYPVTIKKGNVGKMVRTEETNLSESTMSWSDADKLSDRHVTIGVQYKKAGNMAAYNAHAEVSNYITDRLVATMHPLPVKSSMILKKSDAVMKKYPPMKKESLDEAKAVKIGKNDHIIGQFKGSRSAKLLAKKSKGYYDIFVYNEYDGTANVILRGVSASGIEKALEADYLKPKMKAAGGYTLDTGVLEKLTEDNDLNEISKEKMNSYLNRARASQSVAGDELTKLSLKTSWRPGSLTPAERDNGNKAANTYGKRSMGMQTALKQIARKKQSGLTENFKVGVFKLKDGSSVTIKAQDASLLNQMFDDLTPANRRQMMKVLEADKAGFTEILGFAREAL